MLLIKFRYGKSLVKVIIERLSLINGVAACCRHRKCSQSRLKEATIRLPVDSNGEPDYDLMKAYISHLEYSSNLEPDKDDYGGFEK